MLGDPQKKLPVIRHQHRHRLRNFFECLDILGQGTYGKVELAIDKTTGEKVRT